MNKRFLTVSQKENTQGVNNGDSTSMNSNKGNTGSAFAKSTFNQMKGT